MWVYNKEFLFYSYSEQVYIYSIKSILPFLSRDFTRNSSVPHLSLLRYPNILGLNNNALFPCCLWFLYSSIVLGFQMSQGSSLNVCLVKPEVDRYNIKRVYLFSTVFLSAEGFKKCSEMWPKIKDTFTLQQTTSTCLVTPLPV